jgi:hypothetical protein
MAESYTLAPGERRRIKIEDPNMNVDSADGIATPLQERCTVLVEPAPSESKIELHQIKLIGDELKTLLLQPYPSPLATHYGILLDPSISFYSVSNIGSEDGALLFCESTDVQLGCTSQTKRIEVPPYTTKLGEFKSSAPYLIITKSKEVMGNVFRINEGETSTFNVDSGITFGEPVKK